MPSLFERPELNKIFLVYGALDDMFMSSDLQKGNFRQFLNSYLRGQGYDRVVFYSGAKNNGKYVLDDNSARLSINKNRGEGAQGAPVTAGSAEQQEAKKKRVFSPFRSPKDQTEPTKAQSAQTSPAQPAPAPTQPTASGTKPRRRVLSPRERAKAAEITVPAQSAPPLATAQTATAAQTQGTAAPAQVNAAPVQAQAAAINTHGTEAQRLQPTAQGAEAQPGVSGRKLTYCQPKITPAQFLDEAKAMMADPSIKTAVVFPFFQDFITDAGAPAQQYNELLSHLWDEYSLSKNENICVFLAPQMEAEQMCGLFSRLPAGDIFKNRFFNANGDINRGCTLHVGLPNADEIIDVLEYLRIVGDGGKRIRFKRTELRRIASQIMYYSREADKQNGRAGYLNAIYEGIIRYMEKQPGETVDFTEDSVKAIYGRTDGASQDPLETLKNTRGWEAVYNRVNAILTDYRIRRADALKKYEEKSGANTAPKTVEAKLLTPSNSRIETEDGGFLFDYKMPNFIIKGNPGVGKTTAARLIGQIFYDAGILKRGMVIEATRQDLVSGYVGGTAIKTRSLIERAQESVLFIDDAYSLFEEEGEGAGFAHEAVDEIVAALTNENRNNFCLILAGYPDKMDNLLSMNAGLKSRFSDANIITIEDYKPDTLKHIFENNCKSGGFTFETGQNEPNLELFFNNMYAQRDRANFGNARDVVALAREVTANSLAKDPVNRVITTADFGQKQHLFERRGAESIADVYAELDKYAGLGFIKDIFEKVRLEIKDAQDMASRGLTPEPLPDHYIFAGNPGTGKTTVGKLLGEFYHLMGALGGKETIFCDASELIGSHVGDSAERVRKKIQEAIDKNALLYIDEAYQIADSHYAPEIIGAMMTKMTENKDDFKMVFGMYKNRVEDFLKLNAGLSRRLRVIDFPDYTPEQLLEIFDLTIAKMGRTITPGARNLVSLILRRMYGSRTESFGNAGEVKKLADEMRTMLLKRTDNTSNPEEKYVFKEEDIPPERYEAIKNDINPRTLQDIMHDLNELTGLEELKDIVAEKRDAILFAKKCGDPIDSVTPGYYFFLGSPGTGKTTSAKLFAECLYELGVVKSKNFYSSTAKDLIAEYVGQTDKKTYEMLKKSQNGVLFIDEAYSLSSADETGAGAGFKKEALNEIVAYMEDPENKKKSCIILAGYEKDMQGIYKSNQGMRSRIDREVHFRDYTPTEMWDIFLTFCKKEGYAADDAARAHYVPIFEKMAGAEYFANARTAREVFKNTATKVKRRVVRTEGVTPEQAKQITPQDFLSEPECMALVTSCGA